MIRQQARDPRRDYRQTALKLVKTAWEDVDKPDCGENASVLGALGFNELKVKEHFLVRSTGTLCALAPGVTAGRGLKPLAVVADQPDSLQTAAAVCIRQAQVESCSRRRHHDAVEGDR